MFKREFSCTAFFLCVSAILSTGAVSAQTCQSAVNGAYTYSAVGDGIPGALTSGGSTTAATPPFSSSGVGQLVGGAANAVPFTSAGTLYFDGMGDIRPGNAVEFGAPLTLVGSYVLNSDCTISVTLTDAFGTNLTVATLQGVVLGNGSEIDLGQLQSIAGNSASPAIGVYQSNLLVKLVRPLATYCSVGNLNGSYVLIARGARAASVAADAGVGPTVAPFFLFARVRFDGNGNILTPTGPLSTMSFLQLGGSYTVKTDCTGILTLTAVDATIGAPGSTLSLNFALTQSDSLTGSSAEIQFSGASQAQTLFGYGRLQ
jgi:hypothetical protein